MTFVRVPSSDINKMADALKGVSAGTKKVFVRAINKSATSTKVQIKKRLGQELNLTAARIDKDLSVSKATVTRISGGVIACGEPVGLINFAGKQLNRGVKVKVKRASSPSLLKHAFRATAKNKEHLFWRDWSEFRTPWIKKRAYAKAKKTMRFPLERLVGPRIEDVLAEEAVLKDVEAVAAEIYTKTIGTYLNDLLRGIDG